MITIRIGASKSDIPTTERDHKGKSLLKAVTDYVVLDLETTGLDPSRDQIIEVGALRVRDSQTVDSYQSLVKPSYPIDEFITELTGITNAMLETAPSIRDVLPVLMAFIGEDIVMGHNVNFDVNFIYDNCERQGLPCFSNDFVDTMRISRRLYPQERHHRLCDVTERLGIQVQGEHRALADVETTKACYDAMMRDMETRGITMDDIKPSDTWFNMSDRITAKTDQFDPNTAIYGRTFVFTGALDDMPRKDAMQLVVDLGGLCDDTVNKNTNFLVLGNQGYTIALKDGKSSKHKKAEKLQAKGADIQIISESVFYEMIREAQSGDEQVETVTNVVPVNETRKEEAKQAAALEKQRQKEEQRQARMAEKAAAKAEKEAGKERKKPAGRSILQLDENLGVVKRYDSIADAVRETGINSKSIRDAANGVQKRAGGYIWRYEDTL